MPLSEFDIIQRYFNRQSLQRDDVILGIGDDAALIYPPAGQQLAIAIDTLVEGVHFPVGTAAYDIGWKALAVNLSDLAAMAAEPAWFTLALTLRQADEAWLTDFSRGLSDMATLAGVQLVGGDTTRGPLTISIQLAGYVPIGQALQRQGARVGDEIWVSGTLGDAALGLLIAQQQLTVGQADGAFLLQRLNRPLPRQALGIALRGIATSCIDISDGLLADLGHLCQASQLGASIEYEALPLSAGACHALEREPAYRALPISGGDDYELCFTAPPEQHTSLLALAEQLDCPLTRIGSMVEESGVHCQDRNGQLLSFASQGFQHFGGSD